MSEVASTTASSERETTVVAERWRVRRWRRLGSPAEGPWPGAVLPLLGLLGVFLYGLRPFARDWIEGTVRAQVRRDLDAAGLRAIRVDVSGQDVSLRGPLTRDDDGSRALDLARRAACPTWWSPLDCTRDVQGVFDPPAPPPPPPPPPPPAPPTWPDFRFVMRDGALRLTGEVPDSTTREAIVDAARTKVNPPRVREVVDALHVSERAAPAGYLAACLHGLDVLPRCEAGAVALSNGTFSVHCDVTRASAEGVRAAAREPVAGVQLGEVELLVNEEVQACERALETILRASTIEFDTNSAAIRATNAPLLDRVAAAARQCPGHLRVEGHTDNVGTLELNLPLSRQRAASVVEALTQRGLEGPRLRAEGFGPTRPIADNASAAGRARNRRIEIHVVHDGE